MISILVAVPFEPARNPRWPQQARELAARLPAGNPGMTFVIAVHPCPRYGVRGDGYYGPNARARNLMLSHYLDGHDYVLWIDSDIADYPVDMPTRMLASNPGGCTAPLILLEGNNDRFYDILGFVEHGTGVQMRPPFFRQDGAVVDLDSVGSVYLMPSIVYRGHGAQYAETEGFTEHLSVMKVAKAHGIRIVCDRRMTAYHAYMPTYGEELH